ncbi:hypothetical protein FRC01_002252, partial [Tulasnella sp. 417]
MECDRTQPSNTQAPEKLEFAYTSKPTLQNLPLEVWMMIVDFCRVHDDERYHFGQVCPIHTPTLRNLSLTCRALRSFAEPLIVESVELKYRVIHDTKDRERSDQLLHYLENHPEKNPRVKYLVLENWNDSCSALLRGEELPLWFGNYTNLRGIFFASVTFPPDILTALFKLPQIEFLEFRDPYVDSAVAAPEINFDSFGLKSLKIDIKKGHPAGRGFDTLGHLARGPSLEELEYIADRFRILSIGAEPVLPHTFRKLKSLRTHEPISGSEWERLVRFLRDIPNLLSIRLDPSSRGGPRGEMELLPADMLPYLCQFSGNIITAASFVGGRPVSKIVLLPSLGDRIEITRDSLISLTATSIPLRVLHICEVYILPEILHHVGSLFPWLEEFEWHVTDSEYL